MEEVACGAVEPGRDGGLFVEAVFEPDVVGVVGVDFEAGAAVVGFFVAVVVPGFDCDVVPVVDLVAEA